ncbi:hypothetical protein COCSADRAFT_310717 [Bipolaris sorokiniana ND90Pr]|uniref:Uncharacterized protein n=1 Tax=Cochliobolus sativus (strain ND90Pr / ATCC 201652) TaxID=665912 RepID=M2TAG5_COCSN|nr:uncharacterized protein COCSADRAFT_310717 [Bipolaris sorokiniana ND90Pr]EMD65897.1 hypothetical protein COCSADRAFT_310717 [Bipolaris sorokiniana ND90Pr]
MVEGWAGARGVIGHVACPEALSDARACNPCPQSWRSRVVGAVDCFSPPCSLALFLSLFFFFHLSDPVVVVCVEAAVPAQYPTSTAQHCTAPQHPVAARTPHPGCVSLRQPGLILVSARLPANSALNAAIQRRGRAYAD